MKTFSFSTPDIRAESIEQAARLQGLSTVAWLERLAAITAYDECQKDAERRRETVRRRSRIIPFPRRAAAGPFLPGAPLPELEAGS